MEAPIRTRRRRNKALAETPTRSVDYRHLASSLPLAVGYTDEQIAEIHVTALTVLQELGVQVNHAGARTILARAGAAVSDDQVRFGREMVEAAIASSPPEFTVTSGCGTLHIGGRQHPVPPRWRPALRDGQRSWQADGDLGGLPQLRSPLPGLRRDPHDGALGRAPGHCAQAASPADDAVSDARFGQADLHLFPWSRPGRGRLRDPAPALRPGRGRVPGAASYLHRHQHQLTAHPRRADVPGAHRFRRRGTDVHHHPLYALGRDGAGHDSRRPRPAARRDARGPGADPRPCAPGRRWSTAVSPRTWT